MRRISPENFKRYGRVITCPGRKPKDKTKSVFRVVLTENIKNGWRIAYLLLREKTVDKLEQHPDSFESFEPISGKSLIYVTDCRDPETIECFYLDKPVIVDKGVWHGVLTLTGESEIKITENARVKCLYWPLSKRLAPK
jgi:ureidoglycolate hydrolase